MIHAFSTHRRVNESIFIYSEAKNNGLKPDFYTIPFVLKGVIGLRDSGVCLGKWVHSQSIVFGLDCDVNAGLWLVKMYASFGCVKDARKVFDGMCVRDVTVWNAMVSGYCKVGEFEKARELFDVMEERNVVTWTALIAGYAQGNRACEAVEVFRRMRVGGVKPDEVTMVAVLSACAQLGALELVEWVHGYINEYNLRKSMSLNNALIDMYAKSGNINKAMEVFENMKDRCVITWTTVIAGLALHGFGKEALEIFSIMEKSHVKPNDVTLIAVLSACSHSGLVKSGHWYFNNLLSKYRIKPRIEHYGCMIDLLGRAGCLSEAQELLKQMPFEPNAAIWGSLLAASRLYGNVELGENALEQLVKLEPNNSGNFSLLSNIYAAEGHWSESGSIRKSMRDNGVKKISGVSCIELNSRVHEFVSGNGSHPLPERLFEVLSLLNRHMDLKSNHI
ncbi:pentatricopeptide repeat-containing protein [Tanacetum coccineum]